jgi:tetratricopeptide (TPR) repeat protein
MRNATLTGLKDEDSRVKVAFRIAEVYENLLGAPEKALAAYEQALLAVPDFRPALDGRTRLLAQARDFKRLAEGLAREAATSRDPLLSITALLREAEVHRDELGDPARAIKCFEAVLERDPAHLGALLALEPLYASVGNWEALARVYAMESRLLTDVGARVAVLRELARISEHKLASPADELKQTYFAILQLVPTDIGTLSALERLALASGDTQLLAHVDAKLGAVIEEPALAAAYHTRLAEHLEAAGDPSALDVYRAALGRDPDSLAATRGFSRLAEAQHDPALLEEAAEREARVTLDRESAARLLVESASVRIQRSDIDGAVKMLERALELNPDHEHAAMKLRELLLARGDVERLLAALTRAAQHATAPESMAMLWVHVAELLADKKNDVPAGLVALKRVEQRLPNHVPMLLKSAELYVRDGQWTEAVGRLDRVLAEKPEPELRVEANLRRAAVLDAHLRDTKRAIASLNAVLETDPTNRAALKRLLEIQMREGDEAAPATAARLVQSSADPASRADALATLARLEHKRGEVSRAAEAYGQAVELFGLQAGVAEEFKQLIVGARLTTEYNRYVAALQRYLERTRPAPALIADVQLEISRILGEKLGQNDQALAALQRGLAAQPDRALLRGELADRLKRASHFPEAVQEYRRLLESDVMNAEAWRALIECFKGMQRPIEATLAIGPLVAIGAANDLERTTLGTRPPRTAAAHPGAFDSGAFRSIDVIGTPDPASDLLTTLGEALGKVHPPELERYGLSVRDRISARTPHPLRMLSDRIAAIFGIPEHDLYVHRAHSGALEVEFTDPPGILVPAYLTNLSEAQQTFLLARVMANLARGLAVIDKLAPQALELLLAAAARNVDPSFGTGIADEEFLNAHARRVSRALSRRTRRAMEDAATAYTGAPRVNFVDWVARVRLTSARAAAILSDDLPASLELVRRMEGDLAGLQGVALAQGMRVVQDLLLFWVSDSAFALRRRLGML